MALVDDLVVYLSLDEASGNAIDAHGSNDMSDNNTVGATTGKVGGGRDLEVGSSEYFSAAHNSDWAVGDIDFTLQAWVNAESLAGDSYILSKYAFSFPDRQYALRYNVTTNRFDFFVSPDGDNATIATVTANNLGAPSTATWYLIHAWHDATNNQIGIAVNAGTADITSHSGGVVNASSNVNVGAIAAAAHWDGIIDEVGFWKRVLTSDERTELYNAGTGRDYDYIVGGAPAASTHHLHLQLLGVG